MKVCKKISKGKQKEINELTDKLSSSKSQDLFSNPEKIGEDIPFIFAEAPKGSDLRKLSDNFVSLYPQGLLVLHAENKGKLAVLIRSGKSQGKFKCNEILKQSLEVLGGRGGGKPDMAQGSAESGNIDQFKDKVLEIVQSSI